MFTILEAHKKLAERTLSRLFDKPAATLHHIFCGPITVLPCGTAAAVVAGLTAAAKRRIHDATDEVATKRRALTRALRDAASYQDWSLAATKLEVRFFDLFHTRAEASSLTVSLSWWLQQHCCVVALLVCMRF